MNFSALKRSSSNLGKLTKAIEDANSKKFVSDEREWQCAQDKTGNGFATIRFLPAPPQDGEDGLPWVRIFTHGFKGPGGAWYIENCPTTVGKDCPVCEHNSELWNTGEKQNKDVASKQKRKLVYISNIYIVSDSARPENEGQVKLFKYGKKIFDKITALMQPDPGEEEQDPFNFWTGSNFKLKVKKVESHNNYDDSRFVNPSPLLDGNDEALEKIYNKEYGLKDLVDVKVFKDYDALEARLRKVLGSAVQLPEKKEPTEKQEKKEESVKERFARAKEEKKTTPSAPPVETVEEDIPVLGTDEDDMKYFQDLAEDE